MLNRFPGPYTLTDAYDSWHICNYVDEEGGGTAQGTSNSPTLSCRRSHSPLGLKWHKRYFAPPPPIHAGWK